MKTCSEICIFNATLIKLSMQIVLGPSFFWENLGYKLLQAKI